MMNNKMPEKRNLACFHSERLCVFILFLAIFSGCSVSSHIKQKADEYFFKDTALALGNTGISIYEPATGKHWFVYNANKYFIPASNVKLFTLYAALKYLGDSLPGIRYAYADSVLWLFPTGDPTFLHIDFARQPVWDFLHSYRGNVVISEAGIFRDRIYGKGWAWDDQNDAYMTERSAMPVFGNTVKTSLMPGDDSSAGKAKVTYKLALSDPLLPAARVNYYIDSNCKTPQVSRQQGENNFEVVMPAMGKGIILNKTIPLGTNGISTAIQVLKDLNPGLKILPAKVQKTKPLGVVYSRPLDSVLIPMMKQSDNFFAEQLLLMVSNERLGYMNDEAIIDTLLRTDMKEMPNIPRWVDGSGLSRYNLFTPEHFVYILDKIQQDFGQGRLQSLLPTGGEGTLKNCFLVDSGYIYAKTGTLGNQYCLSGLLKTRKGKELIFSVLNNNILASAGLIRKKDEYFLHWLIENY